MLTMWDAAVPPATSPLSTLCAAAGYIGGRDATHIWTAAEWARVKGWGATGYLLPIYVAPLSGYGHASGSGDGNAAIGAARGLGVPTGVGIALDVEQQAAQAAHGSGYVAQWAAVVAAAGNVPLIYTSAASGGLFGEYERWLAEWNGTPHLIPGTAATQYAAPGAGTSGAVDLSVVRDGFPLWPAHDHGGPPPMPNAKIVAIVPNPAGYTQLGEDGGVFVYGNSAYFHGSAHGMLSAPASGIAYTADAGGYWVTAEDGGVFAFGNAKYLGHAYDGK